MRSEKSERMKWRNSGGEIYTDGSKEGGHKIEIKICQILFLFLVVSVHLTTKFSIVFLLLEGI